MHHVSKQGSTLHGRRKHGEAEQARCHGQRNLLLWHQHPGIARMYCARVDVKPINRRRRSVESVHAPRFKAGLDFTWTP